MRYYKRIDGLRFVAISFVLIEHFASFIGQFLSAGYYGVDLFFVISGFLITSILLEENDRTFKSNYLNFLGRRTLRIFPIYYLTLLFLWVINLDDVRSYAGYLFTYSFNYVQEQPEAPVRHFWSLCVEEQFYLFWPFLVLGLKRKPVLLTLVVLVVVVLGYLQMTFSIFPAVVPYNYWGLFPRMASLALGAFGALILKNDWLPGEFFRSKLAEFFMLLLFVLAIGFSFPGQPFFLGMVSLFLVLKAAGNGFEITWLERLLQNRVVVFLGTISYGMYLFHPIIESLFARYLFDPFWLSIDFSRWGSLKTLEWHSWIIKLPLYTALSVMAAFLSSRYIEKPITSLKHRWFPVKSH